MTGYVHPAALVSVDELSPVARDTLRQVIAHDGYAATFQNIKQYRTALLQHLTNLDAAERRANHLIEGLNMEDQKASTSTAASTDAAACLLFEAALSVFTNLLGVADSGNLLEDAVVASSKLSALLGNFVALEAQEISRVDVSMDVAHVFAQQLIADGWLNQDPDCVDALNRQLTAFASLLAPAAPQLPYPAELTAELQHALGIMNFHTGPMAHVFRAAGYDIARKCEAEQAFVLDRMVRTVITHGKMWRDAFSSQLDAARDAATAKLDQQIERVAEVQS